MFIERIISKEIERMSRISCAIVIKGQKYCGKSEICKKFATTIINLTDAPNNSKNRSLAKMFPDELFVLPKPILFDEWQEVPSIWNSIRTYIDEKGKKNDFFLTGSSTPDESISLHSGIGRFTIIELHTLTTYEIFRKENAISVKDLFDTDCNFKFLDNNWKFQDLADLIVKGGWPRHWADENTADECFYLNKNYVNILVGTDISRIDGVSRNQFKMLKLIKSLARNICRIASINTLANDMEINEDVTISKPAAIDYINGLKKLYFLIEIPCFHWDKCNKTILRTTPKTIFSDVSLACAAIDCNSAMLQNQMSYFGLAFENYVLKDLLVYCEDNNFSLSFYRDIKDREIDCIISDRNNDWIAIEIKLGFNEVENAVISLNKATESIVRNGGKYPKQKIVIVGLGGFLHKREDGVLVIPFDYLKN